jgi:hypothetical protein
MIDHPIEFHFDVSYAEIGAAIDRGDYGWLCGPSRHVREPFLAPHHGFASARRRSSTAKERNEAPDSEFGPASFRDIGLQQNAGFQQPLGLAFALADQRLKLLAFLAGQPHNVLPYRNLLSSHDSPPSPIVARKRIAKSFQIR